MTMLILEPGNNLVEQVHQRLSVVAKALTSYSGTKVVFTQKHGIAPSDPLRKEFDYFVEFENYFQNPQVEIEAIKLHRKHHFTHLVCLREYDLIRAARIREYLKLPGQTLNSAIAYRDKLVMKQIASTASIPVQPFVQIDGYVDLCRFADKVGFPLVVKPRLEAGMNGFSIFRNGEELEAGAAKLFTNTKSDITPLLLAEAYCDGTMAHVDGIWKDGQFKAVADSVYTGPGPQHDYFPNDDDLSGSYMLEPQDSLSQALVDFTRSTILALPTPDKMVFHAEIWISKTGRLILNEIASRTAGMYIYDSLTAAFGIPVEDVFLRDLFETDAPISRDPIRLAANFRVPKRTGKLRSVPAICSLPWVHSYIPYVQAGQVITNPSVWWDSMAAFIISGENSRELDLRRKLTLEWFWKETLLE